MSLSVVVLICGSLAYATSRVSTPDAQRWVSAGEEPDYVEPDSLASLVASSDVIVIARMIARQEPRVQTTTIQLRGKTVPDTKVFTRYLVQVDRTIKAPATAQFMGQQVVEQFVGDASLAEFRRGQPDLGRDELLLFLNYYPTAQTYTIGSWRWQVRKNQDGSAEPLGKRPLVGFYKEHRTLGADAKVRSSGDWVNFILEVESLVPRDLRR